MIPAKLEVLCPWCGGLLMFGPEQVGMTGPCGLCHQPVVVPAPGPIVVTCSMCTTVSQFERANVGLSGPCRGCGQTITVPHPPPTPCTKPGAPQSYAPQGPAPAVPGAYPPPAPTPNAPQSVPLGRAHQSAVSAVEKEAKKKGLRVENVALLQLGEDVSTGESMGNALKARFSPFGASMRTDRVLGIQLAAPSGRFHFAAPFSGNTMFAHELASVLPCALPTNLFVVRGLMGSMSEGQYVGSQGEDDPLAKAADQARLAQGLEWDWEEGRLKVKLKWGMQWVGMPGNPARSLHILKTGKIGIVFRDFGLAWYVERRDAALSFHSAQASGPPPPVNFLHPTLTEMFPLVDAS